MGYVIYVQYVCSAWGTWYMYSMYAVWGTWYMYSMYVVQWGESDTYIACCMAGCHTQPKAHNASQIKLASTYFQLSSALPMLNLSRMQPDSGKSYKGRYVCACSSCDSLTCSTCMVHLSLSEHTKIYFCSN